MPSDSLGRTGRGLKHIKEALEMGIFPARILLLVAEGFDQHIPKGYIYFAMAFSVFVEFLNIRIYRRRCQEQPVDLHRRYSEIEGSPEELADKG